MYSLGYVYQTVEKISFVKVCVTVASCGTTRKTLKVQTLFSGSTQSQSTLRYLSSSVKHKPLSLGA
jgi:hypothetical protein